VAQVSYHLRSDLAMPLKQTHDYRLSGNASAAFDLPLAPTSMHIARFTANEGLIYFNLTRKFTTFWRLYGCANTMSHKPCRFLRHALNL
jgi:hypothetical protein